MIDPGRCIRLGPDLEPCRNPVATPPSDPFPLCAEHLRDAQRGTVSHDVAHAPTDRAWPAAPTDAELHDRLKWAISALDHGLNFAHAESAAPCTLCRGLARGEMVLTIEWRRPPDDVRTLVICRRCCARISGDLAIAAEENPA